MMNRPISGRFLNAMEAGLNKGRDKGYVGWDQHWHDCSFPGDPLGTMVARLHMEVDELVVALDRYRHLPYNERAGRGQSVLGECADVANFAMFIADLTRLRSDPI